MQFIDVTFAYPTATAFKTLNKLCLDVKPGQARARVRVGVRVRVRVRLRVS